MVEKVLETIKKHKLVEKGEGVVIGVSGGPDSVCLLHVMDSLADSLNIRLFAVHINHMLRGEESEADENYVKELCESLGIPLFASKHDVEAYSREKRISVEEAGREIRYRQFELVARKTGAGKIAVAHNRNDQAETVLMNIIRGTGLDGLKGMEYRTGMVIRPLLDISREEIEEYCKTHSLAPRTDSSNLQSIYTRNRIRLNLIPYIDGLFNSNLAEKLAGMASLLREDHDFIETLAAAAYKDSIERSDERALYLNLSKINQAHPALRKRMIRHAVRQLKGDLKGIESLHVIGVENLCLSGRNGSRICLPGGLTAIRSYDVLKITFGDENAGKVPFSEKLNIPGTTFVETLGAEVRTIVEKNPVDIEHYMNIGYNSLVQYFDYEKLNNGIYIRNRREGDIFKPFGSTGSKKLKKYLIDNKIPRDMRDSLPLIAVDNEIVWIIGHKTSDKFKVTENTKNVLGIEFKKLT